MFSRGDLKTLVLSEKDALLAQLGRAEKAVLAAKVLHRLNGDEDFGLWAKQQMITEFIERVIREVKHREETFEDEHRQGVLEGFEHLQKEYACEESGETLFVKVFKMTPEAFAAKEEQHRKMGDGHHAHADELRRYCEHLYGPTGEGQEG